MSAPPEDDGPRTAVPPAAAGEPQPSPAAAGEPHPDVEAQFTDLEEGALPPEQAAEVRAHLASCPACAAAHADFARTLAALSGLKRIAAPPTLPGAVEETIHRRSGGRFFGRRAFGDRVPFEVLALIALAIIVALFLAARSSTTGSLGGTGSPLGTDRNPSVPATK